MPIGWRALPNGQIDVEGEGVIAPVAAYVPYLEKVTSNWLTLATKHSARTGVPLPWVLAVITAESGLWPWGVGGGDPKVESPAGAVGLMQLMPVLWRGHTKEQIQEPDRNVEYGTDYLAQLRGAGLRLPEVASSYNGGPRGGKYGLSPKLAPGTRWGYVEDKGYIDNVVRGNNWLIARATGSTLTPLTPEEKAKAASSARSDSGLLLAGVIVGALVAHDQGWIRW